MNIGSLIPQMPTAGQMSAALPSGNILSFEMLMPGADRSPDVEPALVVTAPTPDARVAAAPAHSIVSEIHAAIVTQVAPGTPVSSKDIAQIAEAPPAPQGLANKTMSVSAPVPTLPSAREPKTVQNEPKPRPFLDGQQFHSASTVKLTTVQIDDGAEMPENAPAPVPTLPPAPESKAVRNDPRPVSLVDVQQYRFVSTAKTSTGQIEDSAETPDGELVEPSEDVEMPPVVSLTVGPAASSLPLHAISPAVQQLATETAAREPATTDIVEPQQKPALIEKSGIWMTPLPAPVENAQPVAITTPVATDGYVVSGHLDLARDTLWLDQLAREIVAVASNDGRLKFSLAPATLGNLEVAISTQADGVNIQMQPSTEAASRIIAAEQPKLTEELRQSGIKLVNSDLLGGQQMGHARDHSQAQHSDRSVPFRQSAQPTFPTPLNPSPTQPRRGRFA